MCQTLQTEKKTKKISGKSRGTALKALLLAFFSIFAMHEIQAQCTCAGNLVLNPSFESGTSNWSASGGNLSAGGGAVKCGSYSGDFQITNNSNNWVSQTIASGTIPAGSTINLSVYAGTHNNSFYHEVKVMYFNASWGWISQSAVEVNKVLSASPVGPQLYNITSTVPAGTHYIQVGFNGNGDWIKTDAWCATATTPSCNPNDAGAYYGFCAPTPTCASGSFLWQQTINQSTGNPSIVRLISGSTNSYTISSGFPAAFGSNVNITVGDVVSWDGYSTRNTVTQANERWRLVFKKSGSTVYSTPYTNDVPDYQKQGYWRGALGTTFNAPTGIDQVVIEHYDVANGNNGPGSVVPVSICLDYSAVTCNNVTTGGTIGYDETICGVSGDPANIVSLTAPTGGSGNLEYMWLVSYDGGSTSTVIAGASGASYDPGVITQTTWYRRCARRAGCSSWPGESNWIKKELSSCCDNVTTGGTIGYDESVCGVYLDPANIVNVTLPTGGTGNLEYVWLISYDGGTNTSVIAGATGASYDPGPISQTTWYRRCARRAGCSSYVGESNWIKKELTFCAPSFTCPSSNYSWTQTIDPATGNPSVVKLISGSTNSYTISSGFPAAMTSGAVVLQVTNVVSYDGYIGRNTVTQTNERWRLIFKKSGTTIYSTPYTTDVPDLLTQASWSGALGTSFTAPNGIDQIVIEHIDVANGYVGPGSVIPTGICISYQSCPTANAGNPAVLTCTTPSAVIGTAAVAGNTYSWAPSAGLSATNIAQPTATSTATTTYTVTVTSASGCTATSAVTITVNKTPPSADAGADKTTNCINPSVVIGTPATPGTSNTYSWSPSAGLSSSSNAQPTANPAQTTTYTVTVTGTNGCTASDVVVVTVNKTPPTANAGPDKNLNCTTTSTTIGTAAVGNNSYSWSPATGLSSTSVAQPTANPSTTTTYIVTVTGSNGCTSTDAVIVNVNTTVPTANAGADKNLNCTTTSTTIGTAGVVGNSYSWSPATGLSSTTVAQPTANPSATTTYTLTVTNAGSGCIATDVVTVNVNTTPPTANAGPDKNLNCTTTSTTIGTAAVAGNTYSWSPATGLSSTSVAQPTANPSTTTTYIVTVTGSNGCTSTDAVIVNVNTTVPTADAGADKNLNCTTTSTTIGTASVVGNSYSWSPATGLSSTTVAQPTANPSATTTYTLTVTNAGSGCIATDVVTVNVNTTPPTANAGPDKNLNCTTTSTTIGTAAVGNNTYSWSPATGLSSTSVAQPTANPSTTTTYIVTVTGSNGCTSTDAVIVNVNTTVPTADAGADKNLNCTTTSTTIGTAGVVGNSYSWSPATGLSSTTVAQPTANPSATTTYTLTVTNAGSGCIATDVVTVNVNTTPPTANAGPDKNLNCTTTSTTIGTAAVGNNTYSWSPATGLSSTSVAQPTANPSTTTTYIVTVTGSNGCTSTDAVIVNVNTTVPTANAGPDKNLNCTTTSTTIGTASVSGNTYSWSPATGLSSTTVAQPTASPTATTTYTLTVTNNGSNCVATDVVTVNVDQTPPSSGISGLPTVCATESLALQASPTNSAYSYAWSATGGATASSGTTSSTVTYTWPSSAANTTQVVTLVVTNTTNGCSFTYNKNINVTTEVFANAGPDKSICQGGSTQIGATPSGPAGAVYSWSPNYAINSTSVANPVVNPLVTTTYTLTTTLNGCVESDVMTVTVNTLLGPGAEAGNNFAACIGQNVTLGGNPTSSSAGVTYLWTPSAGLNNATIANPTLTAGTSGWYKVKVTNNSGCYNEDSVFVTVNPVPTANAGADKNLDCTTTSSQIGSSAVAGNTYSWLPSAGLNNASIAQPIANPSATTTYTVTVSNSFGCTATDVVTVNVNNTPPTANAGPNKNLNCTTTSTMIGTAAVAGNSYSWAPATGLSATNIAQPVANPSATTTYTVTVTAANGCTSTDAVVVNVNTNPPSVDAGPDKNLNCTTISAQIGTPAVAGYTYSWLPNGINSTLSSTTIAQPTANPSVTTTYTVIVTGTNGCTASDVVTVNVDIAPPTANAGPDKDVCSLNSMMIGTAAVAGNTYSWAPSTGLSATNIAQPTANPSSTISYTVTVTGANGCTSTDVVVVNFREGSVGNYVWSDLNGDGINNEAASQGINGVTVELYNLGTDNQQGTNDDQLVASTATANNGAGNPGYYGFKICNSGDYYVKFPTSTSSNNQLTTQTASAGTDNNSDANVTTGMSPVFNINTAGSGIAKDNNTIDAGFVSYLSLGNLVWNDLDRDGNKDANESGVDGAVVYLYADVNNDGTPDGPSISTVTTSNGGQYVFNGLTQGNYIVGVVPPSPASGNPFASSPVNENNPNANADNNDNGILTTSGQTFSGTITLTPGAEPTGETPNNGTATDVNSNLTLDFGFYQPVNISGNVFVDNNGPANVDGTGTGSAGSTPLYANLIGSNGNVVASVAVNPNGTYQFLDVAPNTTYSMVLSTTQGTPGNPAPSTTLPSEWTNVSEDCCDNTGNDGNTNGQTTVIVALNDVPNVNFGITQPLSLGNLVWNDLDRDGIKDANESGIDGAVVYLYADNNNDGTPDGSPITNVTTSNGGQYVFNGLTPGNYIVGVVPPAPASGNPFASSPVNEANPNTNGDNNDNGISTISGQTYSGTINLQAGAEPTGETPNNASAPDANANLTLDFGFFQSLSIYGNVFVDNNGPTNVDGTGTGTAGSTPLYANLIGTNGNVIATVPVNPNGTYQFNDVDPNLNYCMVLSTTQGTVGNPAPSNTLPSGWKNVSEDCCDNTGNDGSTNGQVCFSVGTSDVNNINFGITEPLSLGNLVWNDTNRDGIKDANESGIENAVVNLYADENNDCLPDGAALQSTTTSSSGLYVFTDLIPGKYIVGVTPPVISGGTYTSSAAGEETNPNANGDNNDNGINTVGNETRSCAVVLAAGTEPTGETPNNGVVPDANANLTVDFGFFVCPDNWTPVTVSVCAGTTVNLQTLEPAGFTGGTWTLNGNTVSNFNVSVGTYVYTFTNGSCTASGSFVLVPQIPDYAPTITITPAVINGPKPVRVVINVSELLNMNSCTPVYVFVPRLEPRYTFTWNPTATQIGTGPTGAVNNAAWQYFSTNPNFYVWKYIGNPTFPANGSSKFGYAGVYDPNNTDGVTTFSVQIFQGSGGEINLTNNTDSEELIYFRN
jgi:hypothetical protein